MKKEDKRFFSALSTDKDWRKAVSEAAAKVAGALTGGCDLAVVFATDLHQDVKPAELPELLRQILPCRVLIGCNASGVIAGRKEIEMKPAVSVMGMRLPGVEITPFHLSSKDTESLKTGAALLETLDIYPTDKPKFLAFADPMTCDIEKWIKLFNEGYPGAPVIGGLASGMAMGRPNWLVLGLESYSEGSVGVALSGDVEFDIVVAQGCRPIGEPRIITKAEAHVLRELGGRPPLEILSEVIQGLSPADQELARRSLFAGLVMDEYRGKFKRGDFLIRNIVGLDEESGALMIGADLRAGQTLQFQLRDARTSDEDLKSLIGRLPDGTSERGALLVSCCGRGQGLYGEPDHDSALIQTAKGPLPMAGFFANGEIGPVGGKNYVHGYTSSLALIR
ncbi:MAG: FIST signal transduction protein [Elusimicrobiota bacterium]